MPRIAVSGAGFRFLLDVGERLGSDRERTSLDGYVI
jgi:hypothetical protein